MAGRIRSKRRLTALVVLLAGLLAAATAADPAVAEDETPQLPELKIEGPRSHAGLIELLEGFDRRAFSRAMELVGLTDPGPPIRVLIAPEGTPAARRAPSWSLAYAIGEAGLVVLLPSRVDARGSVAYPDRSLDTVLQHEVAHVLIARAAGRRPVPRWFNEGLAIYAARPWGIDDRTRLVWATFGHGPRLADLDDSFRAGSYRSSRAYALSAAFVRYLLDRHGPEVAARILAGLGEDLSFAAAFRRATGSSLAATEERFWSYLDFWHKWMPFLTSSATLWMAITVLALVAFKRRRERDAEIRRRWLDEELAEAATDGWVH